MNTIVGYYPAVENSTAQQAKQKKFFENQELHSMLCLDFDMASTKDENLARGLLCDV